MRNTRVTMIVEIALTVALSAVLNLLRVWHMPQGGTVSFVMLPLLVLALRRGPVAALVAGSLYGCVDFMIDPYPPLTWLQPILDYPVAYGTAVFAGLFSRAWRTSGRQGWKSAALIIAAAALFGIGRYVAHTVSGVVFFGEYAPAGQPVLVYSMVYNLYVPVCAVLAAVGAAAVLPALETAVPVKDAAADAAANAQ